MALVVSTFPEDPYTAKRIVGGESQWRDWVCGPINDNGTIDCGLWQINDIHLPEMSRLGLDRKDPEDATKFARILYDKAGGRWTDWMYYINHIAMI